MLLPLYLIEKEHFSQVRDNKERKMLSHRKCSLGVTSNIHLCTLLLLFKGPFPLAGCTHA